jgi:flavin reductase (DIM6/NTAB) family NADH-FMN oxidoreductase RutF
VLSAKDSAGRDCGCIINTLEQVTSTPMRISITVNKANYTHKAIMATGEFTVSILTESTPFSVFENFGFCSSRDNDKFAVYDNVPRGANGVAYMPEFVNAFISGKVISVVDCGTHSIFIADVTESKVISDEASLTYAYYYEHIKPKKSTAPSAPGAPKRKV